MKLSVKLCSFYRQIKDADHSAQRLASDVSLTCSILHQLGKTLEQDSQTKLCSQQAFLTAQEVLEECERIFKQIQDAIEKKDPGSGKSRWERGTRRLTIVILGPDLEVLKSHLDRLKSTMLLMLNVIMYAREINRYVLRPKSRENRVAQGHLIGHPIILRSNLNARSLKRFSRKRRRLRLDRRVPKRSMSDQIATERAHFPLQLCSNPPTKMKSTNITTLSKAC